VLPGGYGGVPSTAATLFVILRRFYCISRRLIDLDSLFTHSIQSKILISLILSRFITFFDCDTYVKSPLSHLEISCIANHHYILTLILLLFFHLVWLNIVLIVRRWRSCVWKKRVFNFCLFVYYLLVVLDFWYSNSSSLTHPANFFVAG
jgi:hypothetical protein